MAVCDDPACARCMLETAITDLIDEGTPAERVLFEVLDILSKHTDTDYNMVEVPQQGSVIH